MTKAIAASAAASASKLDIKETKQKILQGRPELHSSAAGLLAVGQLKKSYGLSLPQMQQRLDAPAPRKPQPLSAAARQIATIPHAPIRSALISQNGMGSIKDDPRVVAEHLETTYTTKMGHGTDQKNSGRCWIFAGLNVLRTPMLKKYTDDFQYSQNYIAFWDKLQRTNTFLEYFLCNPYKEMDDSEFRNFVKSFYEDGGEWEYFINIVNEHGLVPASAMPETAFSGNSEGYMTTIKLYLREQGALLQKMARDNPDDPAITVRKEAIIAKVSSILQDYLGTPPEEFPWKDQDAKRFRAMTPLEFRKENPIDINAKVHLCDLPYAPKNTWLISQLSNNVIGGQPVRGLNVGMRVMLDAARRSIKAGVPVLIGSDTKFLHKDANLFSLEGDLTREIFGFDPKQALSKGNKLKFRVTSVAHATVLTGCDDPGTSRVTRGYKKSAPEHLRGPLWQLENSWGEKQQTFFLTEDWLKEYLFEIVVEARFLTKAIRKMALSKHTPESELSSNDPFGEL
jgi:bleomycin hydrolase